MIKRLLPVLWLVIVSSTIFSQEIPFKLDKGVILIPAKIKKDIAVEVAIASGSQYGFLNSDLALRHKLRLSYTSDGPVTGRNDKLIHFVELSDIVVGDLEPESLNMKHRSFEAMNKKIGREIGAILGADFFKGKILQIDFKKRVLRIVKKSSIDYAQLRSSASGNQVRIFDMDQPYRTFYGSELTLPVASGITFNGSQIRTLFETGTAIPVSISPAAAKEFTLGPVPDKGSTKVFELSKIDLSGLELAGVPTMAYGKDAGFDENLREYGAIFGVGVIQNFLITFDFKAKKIILQQ